MSAKFISRVMPIAVLSLVSSLPAKPVLAQSAVSLNNNVQVEGTSASAYLSDRYSMSAGVYLLSPKLDATFNGTATRANIPVDFGHDFDMNNGTRHSSGRRIVAHHPEARPATGVLSPQHESHH